MGEYRVPALERAFSIIDMLEHSSLGLTKTEIAKRLDLPYSSVFNILNTLHTYQFAVKDEETGRYYLGPRMMNPEHFQEEHSALRKVAAPAHRRHVFHLPSCGPARRKSGLH